MFFYVFNMVWFFWGMDWDTESSYNGEKCAHEPLTAIFSMFLLSLFFYCLHHGSCFAMLFNVCNLF